MIPSNLIYLNLPDQIKSTIIVTSVLCVAIIILGLCIRRVKPEDKTPVWLIPFIILVDLINNITKDNIGRNWKKYAPYFLTLAMFLCVSNISGIFGLTSPTSYLIINAALAVITFFIIQITGITSNGVINYTKSLLD